MTFDRNTDADETPAIEDTVTGEELHAYTGLMADGREFAVNARDEETARRVAREQHGGVGVLSIKGGADAADDDEDALTVGDVQGVDDDSAWTSEDERDSIGAPPPSATDGENVSPGVDEFGNVPTPQGDVHREIEHDASTRDAS